MIVIVTSRLFVAAESIKAMDLSDHLEEINVGKYIRKYRISIDYIRPGGSNEEVNVMFTDKKDAVDTFKMIVNQYREQNPDQLYLDKVIEQALSVGSDYKDVEKVQSYDASTNKVRSPRKAKRKR